MGYDLQICGRNATDHAVIPYAVAVDVVCRMKLTVYGRKTRQRDRLSNFIENGTRLARVASSSSTASMAWSPKSRPVTCTASIA